MSVKSAVRDLNGNTDKTRVKIPAKIKNKYDVHEKLYGNVQVFELPPQSNDKPVFMYFHGGAYCHPITVHHWNFLLDISKRTGCGFSMPNYPKIPQFTHKESYIAVMSYYKDFMEQHDNSRVIIGGDSAGGAIALSVMQQAREKGLPLPQKSVLISPYTDITGGVKDMNKHDVMVEYDAAMIFGSAWANGTDLQNPVVSPYYGDMKDLPPTGIWLGTWEVLHDEIVATYKKMRQSGVDVHLYEKKELMHIYPLCPIKEAQKARAEIAEFIIE